MPNNLFIAYDLDYPGQHYEAVRHRIRELGQWWQFQYSLFWVSTELSADAAYAHVAQAMDSNDRLAVINATGAVVSTWDTPPLAAVNDVWRLAA
jgi:hypothetical protein